MFFDNSTRNGKMDHTTVLNGLKKYDELKRYEDFREIMNELQPILETFVIGRIESEIEDDRMTDLERAIVKCKTYIDFLNVRNTIITTLAESTHQSERSYSFNLVG